MEFFGELTNFGVNFWCILESHFFRVYYFFQQAGEGHREGVKGLTVSRGPDLKRGPEITKTIEK
jgi:hypothetical protein